MLFSTSVTPAVCPSSFKSSCCRVKRTKTSASPTSPRRLITRRLWPPPPLKLLVLMASTRWTTLTPRSANLRRCSTMKCHRHPHHRLLLLLMLLLIITVVISRPSTAFRFHGFSHDSTMSGSWRFGVAYNDKVTLRRARLVPGWVTVFGRAYHLGM